MKVFDCHLHVDRGLVEYDFEISGGNIIFNHIVDYQNYIKSDNRFVVSLIFDYKNNLNFVKDCIKKREIAALKIHSRIQNIASQDYFTLINSLNQIDSELPIIYDAFFYGPELNFQPNLHGLIEIIKEFPSRPIIVAHCGGYDILKYFFHLRGLENVYFDLSLILQYMSDSSLMMDLVKLIRYTDPKRLMFGSDFHYASPAYQIKILSKILDDLKFDSSVINDIFFFNAYQIFSSYDSI